MHVFEFSMPLLFFFVEFVGVVEAIGSYNLIIIHSVRSFYDTPISDKTYNSHICFAMQKQKTQQKLHCAKDLVTK